MPPAAGGRNFFTKTFLPPDPHASSKNFIEEEYWRAARGIAIVFSMNASPFFSVIIPCYKQARFLPEAVASLAHQGSDDFEVFIIDDGSPDNTAAVARELMAAYPAMKLRLLEQPNQGVAVARNSGIAAAKGRWIVALDSDDMLAEGFLAAVAEAVAKNPSYNAITGAYREFGARSGDWKLPAYRPERMRERGNLLCCTAFRRELWEAVGGYDPSHPWGMPDWHFWLKCQEADFRLLSLPVPMLHYRMHESPSMFVEVHAVWPESLALHHCMLPDMYPLAALLTSHGALRAMSAATEERLRRKHACLPQLPLPMFWLGLACEGRQEWEQATAWHLRALARPGWTGAWQAALCLWRLYRREGREQKAERMRALCLGAKAELEEIFLTEKSAAASPE